MPRLICPECGTEFTHMGKRTAPTCPKRLCDTKIPVGGPPVGRSIDGDDMDDEARG